MSAQAHRYRITVTPIEKDGLPCSGRCSIEFEHRDNDDWMRLLESVQRRRGLDGDERAALTIGLRLLDGLSRRHADNAAFAALRPQLENFARELKRRDGA
ncbi:MAG: DUF3861 domain-containing protein [Pseudoxanthomonas sp.]